MSTENKKNMEELLQSDIDLGGFDGMIVERGKLDNSAGVAQ